MSRGSAPRREPGRAVPKRAGAKSGSPKGAAPKGAAPRTIVPGATEGRARKAPAARPVGAGARRSSRAHARRRGPALPRAPRLSRLPAAGRLFALLLAAMTIAGVVALVQGPWLRVERIEWAAASNASDVGMGDILQPIRGTSLLAVDGEGLAARLRQLPAVADARVESRFPNVVAVQVTEKQAAFVWETSAVQLVGADDGTIIGQVALGLALPAALGRLPFVDDQRAPSRDIVEGDRIPADLLATALQLDAVKSAALGSNASRLALELDEACGFVLLATRPTWRAVFGVYELSGGTAAIEARVKEQVSAIRTLFATRDEGEVGWVDARNPGKVYWRPNGPGGYQPC
jgi:cell division septal protein FtsQ